MATPVIESVASGFRTHQPVPLRLQTGKVRVEIYGHLVPSEQGFIVAPLSGRQVLYVRAIVEERRGVGNNKHWKTIVDEFDARDFFVNDGSGEDARVNVQGAAYELNAERVSSSGLLHS